MTVEREMLVERRQVKHRLTLWRMLAVDIWTVCAIGTCGQGRVRERVSIPTILPGSISGMILDDAKQQKLLKDLEGER